MTGQNLEPAKTLDIPDPNDPASMPSFTLVKLGANPSKTMETIRYLLAQDHENEAKFIYRVYGDHDAIVEYSGAQSAIDGLQGNLSAITPKEGSSFDHYTVKRTTRYFGRDVGDSFPGSGQIFYYGAKSGYMCAYSLVQPRDPSEPDPSHRATLANLIKNEWKSIADKHHDMFRSVHLMKNPTTNLDVALFVFEFPLAFYYNFNTLTNHVDDWAGTRGLSKTTYFVAESVYNGPHQSGRFHQPPGSTADNSPKRQAGEDSEAYTTRMPEDT